MDTTEMRREANYWACATHTVTGSSLGNMLRGAADEIDALKEVVYEDHIDKWCFDTLLYVGRRMLAEYYPETVFDGSSGDLGPLYVVALREAIKRIDEQRGATPP